MREEREEWNKKIVKKKKCDNTLPLEHVVKEKLDLGTFDEG